LRKIESTTTRSPFEYTGYRFITTQEKILMYLLTCIPTKSEREVYFSSVGIGMLYKRLDPALKAKVDECVDVLRNEFREVDGKNKFRSAIALINMSDALSGDFYQEVKSYLASPEGVFGKHGERKLLSAAGLFYYDMFLDLGKFPLEIPSVLASNLIPSLISSSETIAALPPEPWTTSRA